jgi:hypothetical protein
MIGCLARYNMRDVHLRFGVSAGARLDVAFHPGILLANLFQGSRSPFARLRFSSLFAFKEGMWGTQISALLGSPTVSPGFSGHSKCLLNKAMVSGVQNFVAVIGKLAGKKLLAVGFMKLVYVLFILGFFILRYSNSVYADVRQASGKLTRLQVHEVGTKYGPPGDEIDVEVVIQLTSQPNNAIGFQLRDDGNRPVHQGMLDLLRDAFHNGWTVTVDYQIEPGKKNGVIYRVWLTKPEVRVDEEPNGVSTANDPIVQPGRLTRAAPRVRVDEGPNGVSTANDPIVRTGRLTPEEMNKLNQVRPIPQPPPQFSRKGGPAVMEMMQWLPVAVIELGPGQSHQVIASVDKPSLVLASATWIGSSVPIQLTIVKDGVMMATGKALPVPSDHGSVNAMAEITAAGNATVSIKNSGHLPVSTKLVVGTVARSIRE